jgi:transposase InsO family protein
VYASTREEHDATLRKVLQRLRDKNLTLNKEKCEFCRTTMKFMGHTVTAEGLMPQESKIEAVLNTAPPQNVKEVKSFLGLLNYCSKFLPNFATVSEPIRKLTRKNISFIWGQEQQTAFEKLKSLLTSASVMAFYNPNAETTIAVDASPFGLGAILSQKQSDGHFKPVAYASRTLNPTERRYSQIERECLAVTWGIEKFRTYVYGLTFKVITDHKPLINIFKPTHMPPARLERMLLRLQSYKFTVEFQSGALNPADILSRSTFKQEKCEISSITEKYMDYLCENAVPSAMTLDQIDKESSQDKFIQELIMCINQGKWPKHEKFKTFFKLRNELSIHNNVILRGNRLIIPERLRPMVLQLAHETHQGIVKTKQMLREKVYWPGIDSEIEQLIKTCYQCQLTSKQPQQPQITPTEMPEAPWQSVGMDLTGPFPGGEYLLVVIDYYSRFPEVEIMKSITSNAIKQRLMKIFATHGLPHEIKTDNAPNMVSQELTSFFKANGIKHHRITPYHPQAAGLVENFNKTLGKCVKTAVAERKNWRIELYKFLMTYRTTPHVTTGSAPASLLFNRTVKNKLPHFEKRKDDSKTRRRDALQKHKMKTYADRRSSTRQVHYKLGQKVLILNKNNGKLDPKWSSEIYTVIGQKGNQVKLKSRFNDIFRRNISQTRPFYQK